MNRWDDGDNVLVKVDRVVRETDSAILVKIDDDEVWLPKSQVAHLEVNSDDSGEVWIPLWLADKKGIDYD